MKFLPKIFKNNQLAVCYSGFISSICVVGFKTMRDVTNDINKQTHCVFYKNGTNKIVI